MRWEAKWQLTEQGQFWADWGFTLRIRKEEGNNIWEFSTGLLFEREWGHNGAVPLIL